MNYALRRLAGQSLTWISLTKNEYDTAVSHIKNIIRALELEERFDVLIGNYEELDSEILRISIDKSLHKNSSWQDGARNRRVMNRRVSNLLSSCRLYLDQLRHGVSSIFGPHSSELKSVEEFCHRQYDDSFSYRLIEALRNYTQHRRLPIDIEYTSFTATSFKDKQVACCVIPMMARAQVIDDEKIKSSVRSELSSQPNNIDLKTHLRCYLQSLNAIHAHLRHILESNINEWEKTIQDLIDKFSKSEDASLIGLHVVIQSDDEHPVVQEKHTVFRDTINELRSLQKRNELYEDLSAHYVTSQTLEKITRDTPWSEEK